MTMTSPPKGLADLLSAKDVVILDGAMATELEARGCDLNDPLWSAKVIIHAPSIIQDVHQAYFRAGADVAITASYQASIEGFQGHGLDPIEAFSLITETVLLAHRARRDVLRHEPEREMLIAGSVGPYGAYLSDGSEYRGDYKISESRLKDFHRPRIEALLHGGADLLAFETFPSAMEALVLLEMLQNQSRGVEAWFSFTLRDATHVSDGTDLADIVPKLSSSAQVAAIGVNCVPPRLVSPALEYLATLTAKPLIVYPNSGETWEADHSCWSGERESGQGDATLLSMWRSSGARIIGGCCRTRPADVKQIRQSLC